MSRRRAFRGRLALAGMVAALPQKILVFSGLVVLTLLATAIPVLPQSESRVRLAEENEKLLAQLEQVHRLNPAQVARLREIFSASGFIGQGNPLVSRHPATPEQCVSRLQELGVLYENPANSEICGHPYMAPLYDPLRETPREAGACIDQFEFPNIPCTYPVVWIRASEAAQVCEAMGKRLCDAHEWEGACQGSLQEPDYPFDQVVGLPPAAAVRRMRSIHNQAHAGDKAWSYGYDYQVGICSAASAKSPGCDGGDWTQCGSNTYPAGYSPACHSPLGVYDLHGNAAEHMNLPLAPDQMASRGSSELGVTEMKGSWFIFDQYRAHEDWCRWRAPFWHGTRVRDTKSHHNYHLGFRCCVTAVAVSKPGGSSAQSLPR